MVQRSSRVSSSERDIGSGVRNTRDKVDTSRMGVTYRLKVEGFCATDCEDCKSLVRKAIVKICKPKGVMLDTMRVDHIDGVIVVGGTGIDIQKLIAKLRKERRKATFTILPDEEEEAAAEAAPPPGESSGTTPAPSPPPGGPPSPPRNINYGGPPPPPFLYGPAGGGYGPPPPYPGYGPPPPYPGYGPPPPYPGYGMPPPYPYSNPAPQQQYYNYQADHRYGQPGYNTDAFSTENPNACSTM